MSMTTSESTGMSLADLRGARTADSSGFDIDMFHAMERRDNTLVADDILRGTLSGAFTYSFPIAGKEVQGVSVIGARHIAAKYGALRHRIVASMEKRGARVTFQTYPFEKTPMSMQVSFLREIADEPDFYKVVIEMTDLKTGYSFQTEKSEDRFEQRSAQNGGTFYERPNFQTIAQSKAFRNGVLAVIPQDVLIEFKAECLRLNKNADLTANIMDDKRRAVVGYAARNGIAVDRTAVDVLTFDQINGLADATREITENAKAASPEEKETAKSRFTGLLSALGLVHASTAAITADQEQDRRGTDPAPATVSPGGKTGTPSPRRTRASTKDANPEQPKTNAAPQEEGDNRPEPPTEGELVQTQDGTAKWIQPTTTEQPTTTAPTASATAADSNLFGEME